MKKAACMKPYPSTAPGCPIAVAHSLKTIAPVDFRTGIDRPIGERSILSGGRLSLECWVSRRPHSRDVVPLILMLTFEAAIFRQYPPPGRSWKAVIEEE